MPVPGEVGLADTAPAEDHAAGGEVRSLDVLHQIINGAVRIVDHADDAINDLTQVMRGNIGGHADGNAVGTVDQKIGETGREHGGLGQGFVKVRVEIDGILVNPVQKMQGKLLHPGFRITHGGGTVTVNGAEVALPVHQRIADIEGLGQTDHGIIDGRIAVRVEFTQYIADQSCTLAVGLVRCHAELGHVKQDPAVYRLESVADVRERTVDNDGHGIGDETLFHFCFQIDRNQLIFDITHGSVSFRQISRSLTRSLFC